MSIRRKEAYKPKSFEAVGGSFIGIHGVNQPDTYARIYESMFQSVAFRTLTANQRDLYLCMKLQYYGKRKPSQDYPEIEELKTDNVFYLNWDLVQEYGLYKPTCKSNFYKDRNVLIEHGLIEIVVNGKIQHKKNVYCYSSEWKNFK